MESYRNVRLDGYFADVTKLLEPHVFYQRNKSELNNKQIQQKFELIPLKNPDIDSDSLFDVDVKFNKEIENTWLKWQEAKENIVTHILEKLLNREPTKEDFKKVVFTYDARGDRDIRFTFEGHFIGTLYFCYPNYLTDTNLLEQFTIHFTPSPTFM